jgi:hypothetical protein
VAKGLGAYALAKGGRNCEGEVRLRRFAFKLPRCGISISLPVSGLRTTAKGTLTPLTDHNPPQAGSASHMRRL